LPIESSARPSGSKLGGREIRLTAPAVVFWSGARPNYAELNAA